MKYDLEQIIHYMQDNKPHSAPVMARKLVENLHNDFTANQTQCDTFIPFGEEGVYYSTCHGIINESDAFASKEEMLKSILGA